MNKYTHLLSLLSIFFLFSACNSGKMLKGDGDVVTHQISMDYDRLEIWAGSVEIHYEESPDSLNTTIQLDKNILDIYSIEVSDRTLKLKPIKEFEKYRLRPTRFVIAGNTVLRSIEIAGGIKFKVNTPLMNEQINIEMAGGCRVELNEKITAGKLELEMAGKSDLRARSLYVGEIVLESAGLGKAQLKGACEKFTVEGAGSVKVHAYDLLANDLVVESAGMCRIEAHVINSARVESVGLYKIRYIGNPEISRGTVGMGYILPRK